jgi:hypothetical protein
MVQTLGCGATTPACRWNSKLGFHSSLGMTLGANFEAGNPSVLILVFTYPI